MRCISLISLTVIRYERNFYIDLRMSEKSIVYFIGFFSQHHLDVIFDLEKIVQMKSEKTACLNKKRESIMYILNNMSTFIG